MTTPSEVESIARDLADPRARSQLLRRHRDEARADLRRIHPTWLARALREESPAVRATVSARVPSGLARLLRAECEPPVPDRAPHPQVLDWVLSLWTERLVGGSDREDDPPVIAGLMRTSPREAYRLWQGAGLVKWSLADETRRPHWVSERIETPSRDVQAWAQRDLRAVQASDATGRRVAPLLGLVTAFRLLPECEPFAMRRALQRIPYPIVRQTRAIAPPTARLAPAAVRLEGLILRLAWDRLAADGRIAFPHPAEARP